MTTDDNEHKETEAGLDALAAHHQAILAATPDILMEVDGNKIYTWANQAGLDFFGKDVIGKEAAFYFEGEQETYAKVEPLFKGAEDAIYVESWQRREDGQKRLLAWWCRSLKDENGRLTGALSSARDITERAQAEERVINSQKLLQRIIDILPIRIFWKDMDLKYLGCNEIFAKDAGKEKPVDLIGKDDFQMAWKEQAELYRKDDRDVMESGKSKLNFEEPQTTPSGERIWLKTSKVPLTDLRGNIIGILGAYEDITERKHTEEALTQNMDALQAKIAELETFNRLTMDRELKMVALKEKIGDLEARLREKETGSAG